MLTIALPQNGKSRDSMHIAYVQNKHTQFLLSECQISTKFRDVCSLEIAFHRTQNITKKFCVLAKIKYYRITQTRAIILVLCSTQNSKFNIYLNNYNNCSSLTKGTYGSGILIILKKRFYVCWKRSPLNFFWRDTARYISTDCLLLFGCGSKWWINIESPVTIRDKKLSPTASYEITIFTHTSFPTVVWQSLVCRGNKQEHTFEYPKA
jgi:hypothetical protein